MGNAILVLNAGSSSLKFALFDGNEARKTSGASEVAEVAQVAEIAQVAESAHALAPQASVAAGERALGAQAPACLLRGEIDLHDPAVQGHDGALAAVLERVARHRDGVPLRAAAHRVVHGGEQFSDPVLVDAKVLAALHGLESLAPLHQPANLAAIEAIERLMPGLPQVAGFDTAFHRGQPWVAQALALPAAVTARGVRRYGFHGLSFESIVEQFAQHDASLGQSRVIVLHLGSGSSLCAIDRGCSVATTMGFSALDGIPMGTRPGSLDPGVLLWLADQMALDTRAIEHMLYRESGLLGVSGVSADMRVLEASSDPHAARAIDLWGYRIGREMGSLAAAMGGVDALVFTAGIGEHSAAARERIGAMAAWLGVVIDPVANGRHAPRISAPLSRVAAWVMPTDEEGVIARHALALVVGHPRAVVSRRPP